MYHISIHTTIYYGASTKQPSFVTKTTVPSTKHRYETTIVADGRHDNKITPKNIPREGEGVKTPETEAASRINPETGNPPAESPPSPPT